MSILGSKVSQPALRIELRRRGECVVFDLKGRLDVPFERDLLREIEKVANGGDTRVIVNCEGLTYLSSRGISAFIAIIDNLRARDGDLKVVGVNPQGALVLDRLGVSKLLQRFKTVDQAVEAFRVPIEDYFSKDGLDVFRASADGRVFHASRCASVRRIKRVVKYASKKECREAGLKACRRCS